MREDQPADTRNQPNRYADGVQEPYTRVYPEAPESKTRILPLLATGTVILVLATAAGFGLGRWRATPPSSPSALMPGDSAPMADSTAAAPAILPDTIAVFTPVDSTVAYFDTVQQPTVVPVGDSTVTTTVPTTGYQTFTPPEEPPATIAPPFPPDATLVGFLYGQHVTARTALMKYDWRIDPGEIISFQVDEVWNDPAEMSQGMYVTFTAMAEGKGVRASGLLRYYYAGGDHDGYVFRDFIPSRVDRVGSW